jgi:hypothetical protein
MSTVLAEHKEDGTRKCDATCHTAKPGSPCVCVCTGVFHAIASRVAAGDLVTVSVPGEMFPVEIWGAGMVCTRSDEPMAVVFSRAGHVALVELEGPDGQRWPVKHFGLQSGRFEWGYSGSGPADTARSILIALGDTNPSPSLYQSFKDCCVARVPEAGGRVSHRAIVTWLAEWVAQADGVSPQSLSEIVATPLDADTGRSQSTESAAESTSDVGTGDAAK